MPNSIKTHLINLTGRRADASSVARPWHCLGVVVSDLPYFLTNQISFDDNNKEHRLGYGRTRGSLQTQKNRIQNSDK